MEKELKLKEDDDLHEPYCSECGGCGFIGCCGIERFLENHVKGKTTCRNEGVFIEEIINYTKE